LVQAFVFIPNYNVPLDRRTMALIYGSGGLPVAPWDVWMGTGKPRYYGDPDDYVDLYNFVKAHSEYFNGYEEASVAGVMGPFVTAVTYTNNLGGVHGPHTTVFHAMRTNFLKLAVGEIGINGRAYTTDVTSTIGYIYIPGNHTDTIHAGDVLTRINTVDGPVDLEQLYMSSMNGYIGSPARSVLYTNNLSGVHGPHTIFNHVMRTNFPVISATAKVVINGQSYTTDVGSTIGMIYLPGDLTGTLKAGDCLTSISNSPASFIVFDQWTVDKRYAPDTEPVAVTNLGVMAFVRAKPGDPNAPVVVHLVDCLDNGAFNVTLCPGRFFNTDLKITVLRPNANPVVSYYSNLDTIQVAVPDLDPLGTGIDSWGLLVVEPQ
jgi:hypothetical protein